MTTSIFLNFEKFAPRLPYYMTTSIFLKFEKFAPADIPLDVIEIL